MSSYSTGTVKLVNASSIIRADSSTNFTTNVVKGNLFKKRGEPVYYTVASVVNGTTLQLSSKYAGTSGTGISFLITRDFSPNLNLPEMSSGDQDFADIYTRAIRRMDSLYPDAVTTWLEDTSSPHARVSATCFTASGDYTAVYVKDKILKIRGTVSTASANKYSLVATDATYNATTHLTTILTDVFSLSATPTRYYYAAAVNVLIDQIKDTHIDWGIGSNQVNASDVPIIDTAGTFTAATVEAALAELKTDFLSVGNITASINYRWVTVASLCTRASNDVFNASGNKTSILVKATNIKVCATLNASYYSYVATLPHYNATTGLTRVTLASQAIPATPVRWYGDTGNTATRFLLKTIHYYPDDFFNSTYYVDFNTGSNIGYMKIVKDWVSASLCVVATTAFSYVPRYGNSVQLFKSS